MSLDSEFGSIQDAIQFLNDWLSEKGVTKEIPRPVLAELFDAHLPNHPHFFKALVRSSGRPPKGAMTKTKAVEYIGDLAASEQLSREENVLYALLLKYQTAPQGNGVDQYWEHKLMTQFIAKNPDIKKPSVELAKQLNANLDAESPDRFHHMSLLRSYQRVQRRKKKNLDQ